MGEDKNVFVLLIIVVIYVKLYNCQKQCDKLELCNKCIQESGCVWCSEPINPEDSKCRSEVDVQNIKRNWCRIGKVMKPKEIVIILEDKPFNDGKTGNATQIKPQRIKLIVRKGQEYNVTFQYSKAANYPVDLYYLMDLSHSMKNHKNSVADLGNKLVKVMMNITTNFRLGFGSFIDKIGHPFVNMHPTTIEKPCPTCTKAYSYKNHLSLTSDHKMFSNEVTSASLSSNLDYPEGGFDAMMQVIVCKKEIGWRDAARHLLVFSTDADSHIAGDGRLVGAIEPNDGKCHLTNNEYDKSLQYDYPSISFLNHVAKENNINLIFAIVAKYKRVEKFYQNIYQQFDNAQIGKLDHASKNIANLVFENYNKIVDSVRITTNISKSIDIKLQSSCNQTDSCSDIRVGQIVNFTATIKQTECKNEIIQFKPEGVAESLLVEVEVLCNCDCEAPGHEDYMLSSANCSENGDKVCGVCQCHSGYFGNTCECNQETSVTSDDSACKQNSNDTTVCSGRGICECGTCICDKSFYEKYCECESFSCKKVNGLLCGGPDRGTCACGQCKCFDGWKGDDCNCLDNNALCTSPNGRGKICSNHGKCICGKCECQSDENKYFGRYCEECPSCEGQRCQEFLPCVECQVFKTGLYNPADCRANCTEFETIVVDKIEEDKDNPEIKMCSIVDDMNCAIFFQYQYEFSNHLIVHAQKEKRCYEPLNLLVIGLSILGNVIIIGLVTLIIWKIVTSIHDKIEYEKFEKERMESKWHHGDNPLYVGASSTFQNPMYRKSK